MAILAATLVLMWLLAPDQAPVIFTLLAGIMLVSLGLGLWVSSQVRLEVSNSAILFRGWGYRVSSNWEDLLGYSRRSMGVFTVEALTPILPMWSSIRWWRVACAWCAGYLCAAGRTGCLRKIGARATLDALFNAMRRRHTKPRYEWGFESWPSPSLA